MLINRLRELELENYYRSGQNSLVRDFYHPCLEVATSYRRAVGFFTSGSFAAAAEGLRPFLDRRNASMQIVASPQLSDEDVQAISDGYDLRQMIEQQLISVFEEEVPDPRKNRLRLLAWLIEQGRLDIKIALVSGGKGIGIYHEKVGIFSDQTGDSVVFLGSANESAGGLIANFESLEVFRSWNLADSDRVQRRIQDFEKLWSDMTPGLTVLEFPEAAKKALIHRYSIGGRSLHEIPELDESFDSELSFKVRNTLSPSGPILPKDIVLRDYQIEAIQKWFASNGHGIWEMATGSGKTVTAMAAVTQLFQFHSQNNQPLAVVVVAPFLALVEQWAKEQVRFGVSPIRCSGEEPTWRMQVSEAILAYNAGILPFISLVVSNQTFSGEDFQSMLESISNNVCLVIDEVHNVGAPKLQQLLPQAARYRLGLSATPDRYHDLEGTAAIRSYFGEIIFEFSLDDAIRRGALVPYRYVPVQVELDDEELDKYVELTKKIGRLVGAQGDVDSPNVPTGVDRLLFERSRLVGNASGKLSKLKTVIEPFINEGHALVYCAEGQTSSGETQLQAVLRILGKQMGMRAGSYTFQESKDERESIIERFASGDLQVIAAMKCLDEGVDIPATRRAFILASTQNPRQFVQRRGRVLRPAPGKKSADIFDFIVVPPDLSDDRRLFEIERKLVGRELRRVIQLCESALNGPEALGTLLSLRERYQLLSLDVESKPINEEVMDPR